MSASISRPGFQMPSVPFVLVSQYLMSYLSSVRMSHAPLSSVQMPRVPFVYGVRMPRGPVALHCPKWPVFPIFLHHPEYLVFPFPFSVLNVPCSHLHSLSRMPGVPFCHCPECPVFCIPFIFPNAPCSLLQLLSQTPFVSFTSIVLTHTCSHMPSVSPAHLLLPTV